MSRLKPLATHSEALSVASVLQFIVACIESEGLHDRGPGPEELPVQLPHWNNTLVPSALLLSLNDLLLNFSTDRKSSTRLGVLGSSLGCPRSCFDVTSLLKGEDKASISDYDLSCIQALQNALSKRNKDVDRARYDT